MAKKKKNKKFEEINGIKYEIKNLLRKNIVKVYQDMVINAHAEYVAKNRMMENRKKYAELLLKNVSRAPFTLGWLKWPKEESKIRIINGFDIIDKKNKKIKK